jgi:hypothetical protein
MGVLNLILGELPHPPSLTLPRRGGETRKNTAALDSADFPGSDKLYFNSTTKSPSAVYRARDPAKRR